MNAGSAMAGIGFRAGADVPCRTFDGDLWFSDSPSELRLAGLCCGICPSRTECLAGALDRAEPWGVWGGELFQDGIVVPRRRPRGRPPKKDSARYARQRVEAEKRVAAQLALLARTGWRDR